MVNNPFIKKASASNSYFSDDADLNNLIINSSPNLIYCFDKHKHYLHVNDKYCLALGLSAEEIIGKTYHELGFTEDLCKEWDEMFQTALTTKTNQVFFSKVLMPNKTRISFKMNLIPIKDADDNVDRVVVIQRNISQLEDAYEKVERSKNDFLTIFENAPDIIAIHAEGKFLFINKKGIELAKAKGKEDFIGKNIYDFVHPGSLDIAKNRAHAIETNKKTLTTAEMRYMSLDGTAIDVEVRSMPISFENKDAVLIIARDTSERIKAQDEIKENKEKYKGLSNASFESIFLSDKGICIEQNQTAERIFGYTNEDAIGKYGTEWIAPEYRELVMKNMLSGYEKPYEAIALRKDGTTFPCLIRAKMVHYKGKDVRATSILDISDLKQMEKAMQDEQLLLRTIIDNIPDSVYVKDINGRKLMSNPQDLKYMGLESEKDAIGKHDVEIYSMGQASKFKNDDDKVLIEGKSIINHLHYFIDNRQEAHWLLTSKVPLRNQENKIVGLVGTGRDITERQNMLEQLYETQERLNKIVLSSSDWVWEMNGDGEYSYVSDQVSAILGYNASEMIGKSSYDFLCENEKEKINEQVADFTKNGIDIIRLESWLYHKNGTKVCISSTGFPVFDNRGNRKGYIGVGKDITERIVKENELSELNEKLTTLIEAMPDAVFFKNKESRWTITNAAAKKLFELEEIDWYGKSDKELSILQPDLKDVHLSCISSDETTWKNETVSYFTEKMINKEGIEHQLHVTKVPLFEKNRERKGIVIIARDVTQVKKEEERLRLLEAAFLNTTDSIVISEQTFPGHTNPKILFVNPAFEHMTGYSKNELIGNTALVLRGEKTDETELQKLKIATENWQPCNIELINYKKGGEEFWVNFSVVPVADELGHYTNWVSIQKDVSEKKKQEQAIKKAIIQGQEKEKYLIGRELHDNVAQILVGAKLTLSMIKGNNEKEIEWLEQINNDINDSITELRNLSHDLAPSTFKNDNFIITVEALLKSINNNHQFEITLEYDALNQENLSNELKLNLYRILQEQLQNIIKHAAATMIDVRFYVNDNRIQMKIYDNGKGFDEAQNTEGIGLQNIKARTDAFSGICTLTSSHGNGCELVIEIPLQ